MSATRSGTGIGQATDEVFLEVETPEGVALSFPVASAGERLVAYIYDFLIITAIISVLAIPIMSAFWGSLFGTDAATGWAAAIASMTIFFVLNFYFAWHEIRSGGATPGKRKVGLRVINRSGGPLDVQSVLVRNMTRNIEVTVPLQIAVAPQAVYPGNEPAAVILAIGWIAIISCLPLFNRYRLRPGDLLGGTIVVDIKQTGLEEDIADNAFEGTALFQFTSEQLGAYGIYELQVLEDYLRTPSHSRPIDEMTIIGKIRNKIGWEPPDGQPLKRRFAETFLRDFYAAQRRHLEQSMLLGKRKERKDS